MVHARGQDSGEVLDHADEGIDKKFSLSVDAVNAVAGGRWGERTCVNREDGTLGEMDNDPGSNKELQEGPEEVMVHDMRDQQKISDALYGVDQRTSYNSRDLVHEGVRDAVVIIDSAETENVNRYNRDFEAKVKESGLSKISMKAPKTDNDSCVKIDMNCGSCEGFSENSDGERICRICHLASGQPSDAISVSSITNDIAISADLIQLGCACKDELGIAHSHCAEAWFKLKGSRLCEICGETAKNVSGVADDGFMEEWNERRFTDSGSTSSSNFGACWRGQPFCNFLMACLVIAFVLPWFFRVNMF